MRPCLGPGLVITNGVLDTKLTGNGTAPPAAGNPGGSLDVFTDATGLHVLRQVKLGETFKQVFPSQSDVPAIGAGGAAQTSFATYIVAPANTNLGMTGRTNTELSWTCETQNLGDADYTVRMQLSLDNVNWGDIADDHVISVGAGSRFSQWHEFYTFDQPAGAAALTYYMRVVIQATVGSPGGIGIVATGLRVERSTLYVLD